MTGKIYVNGIFGAEDSSGDGNVDNTINDLYIGQRADGCYNFNGTIDEVRISNYAKSASEIQAYYNSVIANRTVLHLPFDEF